MAPRTPSLALLLAVLALAGPLAPTSLAGPHALEVTAEAASQSGMQINVTTDGAARNVTLIVSHEDPLNGTVVDRVVPLELPTNTSARVDLEGLEPARNRTVRLLDAGTSIPNVSTGSQLPDGAAIEDLPTLADRTLPSHQDEGLATVPVPAYPMADIERAREDTDHHALVATRTGIVVAAYTAHEPDDAAGFGVGTDTVMARISHDGGRTFGDPIPLGEPVTNSSWTWVSGARAQGDVVTLVYTHARTGEPDPAPTKVRLDASTGEILERQTLTGDWTSDTRTASTSDGGVLVVDEIGRLHVKRYDPDGTNRTVLEAGTGVKDVVIASGPGPRVQVLFTEDKSNWTIDTWIARSTDGGRTFSDPVRIPDLSNVTTIWPMQASLDAHGQLHVAFWAPELAAREGPGNGFYAQIAPTGANVTVRQEMIITEDAWVPQADNMWKPTLAGTGPRVWTMWNSPPSAEGDGPNGVFAVESTTAGRTFGEPYRLTARATETGWGGDLRLPGQVAILPDGRPVALGLIDRTRLVTLPLFDPLADEETGLTEVAMVAHGVDETTARDPQASTRETNTTTNGTQDEEGSPTRQNRSTTRAPTNTTTNSTVSPEANGTNLTTEPSDHAPALGGNESPEDPRTRQAGGNGSGSNQTDRPVPGPSALAAVIAPAVTALTIQRVRSRREHR